MKNLSSWNERFTWYWFKDEHLLEYTDEDFENEAKKLRERGITIAIVFTFTHWRMGFYRYWDKIHEAFRKFVLACHKYDIKVVEHNSASLIHDTTTELGKKRFIEDIGSFGNWTSKPENWREVPDFIENDCIIDGKDLRTMFQIDGRTGLPAETVYNCHAFCFNNPDYREMYFNYRKKELEVVPFDGMMDDDIQYFGYSNACACEHCRRLFKEQYGYELPTPDEWESFHGDYSNPAFVAWKRFIFNSTVRLNRDLTEFYKKLGYNMMRPNYVSTCMYVNYTLYGFEGCIEDWSHIFQENCFSAVIKQSYPDFMVEAIHRFAAAEKNGVPSMSLFYPDREDSIYFSWALAKSWGQMYTATCEGKDISGMEKKYRDFEGTHKSFLTELKKREDIAFYFSTQTRDYLEDAAVRYMYPAGGILQAAEAMGFKANLVFESDSLEQLLTHPVIALANVALLSDDELKKFSDYAKLGGKLIIMGHFAEFDETSSPRDINTALSALGMSVHASKYEANGELTVSRDGKSAVVPGMNTLYSFDGGEEIAVLDGKTVGVCEKLGKGEVILFSAKPQECELQGSVWAYRRKTVPDKSPANPSLREYQKAHSGAVLSAILGAPKMQVTSDTELYTGAFDTESGIALHLVNIENTVAPDNRIVGHEDIIENFTAEAEKLDEIEISLKADGKFKSATLFTPEDDKAHSLSMTETDGRLCLTVPGGIFSGYALIELRK